jgi:hypothetical protein
LSKTQAQKKADEYRLHANTVPAVELIPSITVAELVETTKSVNLARMQIKL